MAPCGRELALGSAPELRLDTMATYTTLFSATLAELEERFPHVADPLPIPRVMQRTNPFTKLSVQVTGYEPEFDTPRHRRSLFAEGGPASVKPIHAQLDDYDRYLRGLVPTRLRSLPHIGTKNVSFADVTELLSLEEVRPEKYVKCLPGEGIVDVACTRLVELLRAHEADELKRRFPEASQACPFEWLRALLLVPSADRRFLCAWLRA